MYIHIYTYTHIHTYTYIYIHKYIPDTCKYMYKYIPNRYKEQAPTFQYKTIDTPAALCAGPMIDSG